MKTGKRKKYFKQKDPPHCIRSKIILNFFFTKGTKYYAHDSLRSDQA